MASLVFGDFELDPASGELRRGADCVRLQDQPLKLLLCLLDHPGQVVSREELHHRIWGNEIHVDFDDGLNAAAWRLRQALGDSPEEPAYIETVPRKGYRFVGKVLPRPGKPEPPSDESFPVPVYRPDSGKLFRSTKPVPDFRRTMGAWLAGALVSGFALLGFWAWAERADAKPTLILLPLRNSTGDPALDYVAEALTRDVAEGLRPVAGLRLLHGPATAGRGTPMRLECTLVKDGARFRILLNLVVRDQIMAGDVLLVEPSELGQAGKRISHWASTRLGKTAP